MDINNHMKMIEVLYKDPAPKTEAKKRGLAGACWPGYEAYGFKKKNGRRVPNCVPKDDGALKEIRRDC